MVFVTCLFTVRYYLHNVIMLFAMCDIMKSDHLTCFVIVTFNNVSFH